MGLAKPQGAEEEEEEAAPAARFPALLHILSAPALAPKGPGVLSGGSGPTDNCSGARSRRGAFACDGAGLLLPL